MATKKKANTLGTMATQSATVCAIYARVSTEDQAERQTVQAQTDFLRKYCDLHGIEIAGEYVDDGISGTVPLPERMDGQRLLQDAEAGRFRTVIVYRLDRLGRSLTALLEAHNDLAAYDVTLRSATEPFDTGTPIGMFLFQLLGSLAELERSTITERMNMGRSRVAATGKYIGGPIPFGYDLDGENNYIYSERVVPQLGMTEAELIQDLYQRIAAHETTLASECRRLTALGVPRHRRYGGKERKESQRFGGWGQTVIGAMVRNPFYKGESIHRGQGGELVRQVPALVDAATWQAAQDALVRNKWLSKKNAKNEYWLRGLIKCGDCGLSYAGYFSGDARRYRCTGHSGVQVNHPERCRGKALRADWIEAAVWEETSAFIFNPGDALVQAQRKLRERLSEAAGFEDRRKRLLADLASKEEERERVLTLFRRGTISADEAENQLDAVAREAGQLREMLESMRAQAALIEAQEAELTDSAALLSHLRDKLEEIEIEDDWALRREIMQRYVRRIVVHTTGKGRAKRADIKIYLRMRPEPVVVDGNTPMCTAFNYTWEVERTLVAA